MNQVHLLSSHLAMLVGDTTQSLRSWPQTRHLVGLCGHLAPTPTSRSSRTTSVLPYSAASCSAVPVLVWRLISIPALSSCLWRQGSHRVVGAAGQGIEGTLLAPQEGDEEMKAGGAMGT